MYARGQSARDRMQGRLYANAGREFDQGSDVSTSEEKGYVLPYHLAILPRLALFFIRRVIPTTPCKCEKGIVRVRVGDNRLRVTQLIGASQAEKALLLTSSVFLSRDISRNRLQA